MSRTLWLSLSDRFPVWDQIIPVYGLITPFIFGWSLYWFLWMLPSWLTFLGLGKVGSILAYVFVINFLESLTLIILLSLTAAALPATWFRDDFILRGSTAAVCLMGLLMYISTRDVPFRELPLDAGISIFIFFAASILFIKIRFLRRLIEGLADNSIIFSYITIPLSTLSFMIVLIRTVQF